MWGPPTPSNPCKEQYVQRKLQAGRRAAGLSVLKYTHTNSSLHYPRDMTHHLPGISNVLALSLNTLPSIRRKAPKQLNSPGATRTLDKPAGGKRQSFGFKWAVVLPSTTNLHTCHLAFVISFLIWHTWKLKILSYQGVTELFPEAKLNLPRQFRFSMIRPKSWVTWPDLRADPAWSRVFGQMPFWSPPAAQVTPWIPYPILFPFRSVFKKGKILLNQF